MIGGEKMFVETNRRLVLRYDPGQFTFRHFVHTSTDEQLYDLAQGLNEFQEDEVKQVLKVQFFEMM